MNRVWRAAAAAGLFVLAPAAGAGEPLPTGSPSLAGYVPTGKDEKGVWAEADEGERELRGSRLILKDAALNAYLRGVLCRTVGADHCGAIRLYVVRSPVFNAMTMANGAMIVHTGLLLRLRDEAELAAVLGHEFVHFEHRHRLMRLRTQRNAMSWAAWLTMASFATSYPYNFQPGMMAGYFSFSRDNERDADLTGLAMMDQGGYRPDSAAEIWGQMRDEEDARALALGVKSLKDAWRGPFATHPMDVERMSYLQAAVAARKSSATYTGSDPYRQAIAPLWPILVADQIKLDDFGSSEFLLMRLAGESWTGPLLFARAELYRARAKPGDLEMARDLYRQACALPDVPAASWRGLGLTLTRLNDGAGARIAIAEYLTRQPDAGDRAMLESMGEGI